MSFLDEIARLQLLASQHEDNYNKLIKQSHFMTRSLFSLNDKLETIMATLDEVLAEVTDESGRLDSIQALINGIKQQLADALSGASLPAGVQAKVDAVFAGLTANKAKIDTALNTGTPAP